MVSNFPKTAPKAALLSLCLASVAQAEETLITVIFDPATGTFEERPFEHQEALVSDLPAKADTGTAPEGRMIDLDTLESFAGATPAAAPYADTVPLDDSLDVPFGIIGTDDRVRVEPTNAFPASAMTHILFKTANGFDSVCSGSFIAADTVLTAGHCVHQKLYGGWSTDYQVLPGRNGPLEHFDRCGVKTVLTLKGWTETNQRPKDLAALKLDCTIGDTAGYLGLKPTPTEDRVSVTLQGYPGEQKLRGLQFKSADIIRDMSDFHFDHEADTTGGMSGSPVMDDDGQIIGVHTATTKDEYWTRENQLGVENHATRITNHRLALIQNWIEM